MTIITVTLLPERLKRALKRKEDAVKQLDEIIMNSPG